MYIHMPYSISHGIFQLLGVLYVILSKDVISAKTLGCTLIWPRARKFQSIVLCLVISFIFDMVPYAKQLAKPFVPGLIHIFDRMIRSSYLYPPISSHCPRRFPMTMAS